MILIKRTIYIFLSLLLATTYAIRALAGGMPEEIHKGMSYVTWDEDGFNTDYSDESLEKLASLGVSYISICPSWYQEHNRATEIEPTDHTPDDRGIARVIKKAQDLDMKVMLKPHIDLKNKSIDGHWRADIGFATDDKWDKWFDEYENFILHYARLGERYGVAIFCVGTELSFAAQKEQHWRDIIARIKKVFKGELVYAANWDNYQNIKFWDEMDYVGIDAYFPLTYAANPSLLELERGWNKWKIEILKWHHTNGMPILFTEIGYASAPHAAMEPWKGGIQGNPDLEVQENCYKAFFSAIWGCSWLHGVYWWRWDTNIHAGGPNNRRFTPQNKPAEDVLRKYYQ